MSTKLSNDYLIANKIYDEHIQKTRAAYDLISSNKIDLAALDSKDGIASVQLNQMALACTNNRSNILKAAHTLKTIIFHIRQSAIGYTYSPDDDYEQFHFNDGTNLSYANSTWT